jgi:hypothetical protein
MGGGWSPLERCLPSKSREQSTGVTHVTSAEYPQVNGCARGRRILPVLVNSDDAETFGAGAFAGAGIRASPGI